MSPRAVTTAAALSLSLSLAAAALACCDVGETREGSDAAPEVDTTFVLDADTTPGPAPELILGVNPVGTKEAAAFSPLADGDALNVELGFQGLWMVVLALKTRGLFEGPLYLEASLSVGGAVQGTLALARQRLTAADDGYGYYFDFFLVVEDPGAGGSDGVVVFLARDDHGHEETVTVEVRLTGGE